MEAIHGRAGDAVVGVVVLAFLGAIVAANLLVVTFGPAVTIVNAFVLIAFDLVTRDILHDAWRGNGLVWKMGALIAAGGAISYAMNRDAGIIAAASVTAFASASTVDAIVYHALLSRPWFQRANASNVFGAAVDSTVFPLIAFGAFLPGIVLGQFAAKVLGGLFWTAALAPIIAPGRHRRA